MVDRTRLLILRTIARIVDRRSGVVPSWQFPTADGTSIDVTPPFRNMMDDLAAIADAVADGVGLAWLPSWLVKKKRPEAGLLVELLPEQSGYYYDVFCLMAVDARNAAPKCAWLAMR